MRLVALKHCNHLCRWFVCGFRSGCPQSGSLDIRWAHKDLNSASYTSLQPCTFNLRWRSISRKSYESLLSARNGLVPASANQQYSPNPRPHARLWMTPSSARSMRIYHRLRRGPFPKNTSLPASKLLRGVYPVHVFLHAFWKSNDIHTSSSNSHSLYAGPCQPNGISTATHLMP